jgi:hypothetical protein
MVCISTRQAIPVVLALLLLGCSDPAADSADGGQADQAVLDAGSGPDRASGPDSTSWPDQTASRKLKVVFIGNSLTFVNDLPSVLTKVAASASPAWTISAGQNHLPGGSSLSSNWLSGTGTNRGNEALDLITKVKPDLVVLQDQSSGPDLSKYPELWHAWIHGNGARTVLFMTWGKGDFGGTLFKQTADTLESQYNKAGAQVGATVAPVGTAWKRHYAKSALKLHGGDALHPSPHGTYLTALVFFSTLTGQAPTGLSTGGLNISAADAKELQQTAWDTYKTSPMAVLSKQPRTQPKDDHPNTAAGATKLILGQLVTAKLGVADADFFAFTMAKSGKLNLIVQNTEYNKLLDLMIMDSKQEILGRNNYPSTGLKVVDPFFTDLKKSPILAPGKYYLRISGTAAANKKITCTYKITSS